MTAWYTDKVEARTRVAQALRGKGDAFLASHLLRRDVLDAIAAHGEEAREADREQQVQLAEAAQARTAGRDQAADVSARESMLAALMPAVTNDLRSTDANEAGFLSKLTFARYRTRVTDVPVEPADEAERAMVRRVERVERGDRQTRARGLAALCATLVERPVIVTALEARGLPPSFLTTLRRDAEEVAARGANKTAAAEATTREAAAARAQHALWIAEKHLIRRACASDPDLVRLIAGC